MHCLETAGFTPCIDVTGNRGATVFNCGLENFHNLGVEILRPLSRYSVCRRARMEARGEEGLVGIDVADSA